MVEAVCGGDVAVLGAAGVHLCAHLAGQHLAQLYSPLVKRIDAPNEALHTSHARLLLLPVHPSPVVQQCTPIISALQIVGSSMCCFMHFHSVLGIRR